MGTAHKGPARPCWGETHMHMGQSCPGLLTTSSPSSVLPIRGSPALLRRSSGLTHPRREQLFLGHWKWLHSRLTLQDRLQLYPAEVHLCSDDSCPLSGGPGRLPFPNTADCWKIYDSGSGIHQSPLFPGRRIARGLERGLGCRWLWQAWVKSVNQPTGKFRWFCCALRRGRGCNQKRTFTWTSLTT